MNETDTDTTLCEECATPVETPKIIACSPFIGYRPIALCKDCLTKAKTIHFGLRHRLVCPFQAPHWRPRP